MSANLYTDMHLSENALTAVGLSPGMGKYMAEAACVCLESNGHQSGVILSVDGDYQHTYAVNWSWLPPPIHEKWGDADEATEFGAYAVAVLVVTDLAQLSVVRRSRKGTGFDFWLGPPDSDEPLFQKKQCLEVSGIHSGDDTAVRARLSAKHRQVQQGSGQIPGYVAIVEFGSPLCQTKRT